MRLIIGLVTLVVTACSGATTPGVQAPASTAKASAPPAPLPAPRAYGFVFRFEVRPEKLLDWEAMGIMHGPDSMARERGILRWEMFRSALHPGVYWSHQVSATAEDMVKVHFASDAVKQRFAIWSRWVLDEHNPLQWIASGEEQFMQRDSYDQHDVLDRLHVQLDPLGDGGPTWQAEELARARARAASPDFHVEPTYAVIERFQVEAARAIEFEQALGSLVATSLRDEPTTYRLDTIKDAKEKAAPSHGSPLEWYYLHEVFASRAAYESHLRVSNASRKHLEAFARHEVMDEGPEMIRQPHPYGASISPVDADRGLSVHSHGELEVGTLREFPKAGRGPVRLSRRASAEHAAVSPHNRRELVNINK